MFPSLPHGPRDRAVDKSGADLVETDSQIKAVKDALLKMSTFSRDWSLDQAEANYSYTTTVAPLMGTRNLAFTQADATQIVTAAVDENLWRTGTAVTRRDYTSSDLASRPSAISAMSSDSSVSSLFVSAQTQIAQTRSQWWSNPTTGQKTRYDQWNVDVNQQETILAAANSAAELARGTTLKNAGVTYANKVATATRARDRAQAEHDKEYRDGLIAAKAQQALAEAQAKRTLITAEQTAKRDLAINGDQAAYDAAMQQARSAYPTALDQSKQSRDALAKNVRDKYADDKAATSKAFDDAMASAEKEYELAESQADATYRKDKALAKKTRDTAVSGLDASYATTRDQSWASTVNAAGVLGSDPWSNLVKQEAQANAAKTSALSSSRHTHDSALLSALSDYESQSLDATIAAITHRATTTATYQSATSTALANYQSGLPTTLGGEGAAGSGARSEINGRGEFQFGGGDEEEETKTTPNGTSSATAGAPEPHRPVVEENSKHVSQEFINRLIEQGAEVRYHLDCSDKHATVSYRYTDPKTGNEVLAIYREHKSTVWVLWYETHWELMRTTYLGGDLTVERAYDAIHDHPQLAQAYNNSAEFMQAIPLVRSADSISEGKVCEAALNLASDVTDVTSLGGTMAVRSVAGGTIKWVGRSALAGQYGLGAYEACENGDYSRLQGAALSTMIAGAGCTGGVPKGRLGLVDEVAPSKIPRFGTNPNVVEVPVDKLKPIHPVPRAGKEADIPELKTLIGDKGYDVSQPISATRLPNGDLIVTGGHHRLEAMKQLGEKTVPVQIYDAAADPVRTARNLGIGRITGEYVGDYMPTLTPAQQQAVDAYLKAWRAANGY